MTARPLRETSGAWYPFWSPDGRYLAFFADGKLKRIDLRGGSPQVIAEAPSGRGGSWGKGDVILFSPNLHSAIHQVPAGGGTPTPVTRFDPAEGVQPPLASLPSGRQALSLFVAGAASGQAEVGRLMLGSLDSLEATMLIDDATNAVYVEPGYLLYGRSGNLYAWRFDAGSRRLIGQPVPIVQEKLSFWEPKNLAVFAASDSGTIVYLPEAVPRTALQWYDASGRALGSLGKPGFYRTPRISPDGKKVAFALGESSPELRDLWILDLQYERTFRLTQKSGRLFAARLVPRFEPAGLRLPTQGSPGPLRRGRSSGGPTPSCSTRRQTGRSPPAGCPTGSPSSSPSRTPPRSTTSTP